MARTKPFIKVHLGVSDHAKTAAAWGDLALRGMLVELWRKAGEKYAARRDDRVPLKATDRMEIACSTDLATADEAVERLCRSLKYTVRKYPNRWEVHVRKFAKKQGFETTELDKISTTSLVPNAESPNAETPKLRMPKAEQESAPTAPPARRPARLSDRTSKPVAFEGEALAKIETWAGKHGHQPELIAEALERFAEWVPQSGKAVRTWDQWVGAFMRIARGVAAVGPLGVRMRERESAAEAKVRRTKEAAQRAVERLHRKPDPFREAALAAAAQTGGAP